jgi:spermidine synthase
MSNAVGLMLFGSGIAALVYQVVWVRLLGLTIGATAVSVAVVLAAFFGGMAMGGLLAQARLRRGGRGLREFALAEGVTAVSALLLLPVLFNLDSLLAQLPAMDGDSAWQFLLVMLVLLIPSVAIGATFPFLAAWRVLQQERPGHTLSALYAVNTLGAMCGALLAGFWLIPRLGLDGALYVAAAINGGVGLLAWWLVQYESKETVQPLTPHAQPLNLPEKGIYVVLAATGFAALAGEVVWSKYLSLYAGTTIYGFAAMTATVLAGMAGGGWLMRLWLRRYDASVGQLLFMLLLLAVALTLTRSGLGLLPQAVADAMLLGEALTSPAQFALLTLVLLPSSLCFGATFPLALALRCPSSDEVRRSLGLALAVNILAAIGGAVITALWLIPILGSDTTLALLPLLPLVAALWLMVCAPAAHLHRVAVIGVVGILVVASMLLPGIDYKKLLASTYYRYAGKTAGETNFRYLSEGRSGLIGLVDHGRDLVYLQRNGLNEGVVDGLDARKGTLPETLLGVLPYLLQEQPRDALVVGFGAGTTTRVLAEGRLESIKVIELEPRVVEAMQQLGEAQWPFLADGRVQLEFNDARASLRADSHRYSIIVSQPSHPWVAGSANLYSREFFELVRSRLRQGGIFGQWVNLFRMDTTTLRSILRTFYEVFPRGVVFGMMRSGDLLLMGGDATMVLDYERSNAFFHRGNVNTMLVHAGISDIRELPEYFLFTSADALRMANDAPVATDANLLVEIRLAGLTGQVEDEESPYSLLQRYIKTDLRSYRSGNDDAAEQRIAPDNGSTEAGLGASPQPYRRIH